MLILVSSVLNPHCIAESFLPTTPSATHPPSPLLSLPPLPPLLHKTGHCIAIVLLQVVFTVSLQGLISTSQYTSLSLARFTLSNLNIATLHIAGHSADSKPSASSYRSILSPRILCDSFHLSGQYLVFCSGHSRKVRTPSAASVNTLHVAKKPTD